MKLLSRLLALLFCAAFLLRSAQAADTTLVSHGDEWRYRPATTAPPANWPTLADAALDASWLSGPGGFGYGDPAITGEATTLSGMNGSYRSLTIRRTFNVAAPINANDRLLLKMDWDDGFLAYLDGVPLLTNNAPANLGFNTSAPATHEASCCDAPTNPARTFDLGPVLARLPVGDHILAVHGWNQSLTSSDFHLIVDLLHGAPPPAGTNEVSGTITTDTTWFATNNFYTVVGDLTVVSGVTLTIEPGVTVRFDPGLGMTIQGRLLAEGTPAKLIRFTRSGSSGTWDQLAFTANATTSRIAHAEMDYFAAAAITATGTTLHLDSLNWTNSTAAVVDLHSSSITLLNSFIPGGAGNEPVHFSTMPANGHALIQGCTFGAPRGYNDSIDFTGGNRPGPVVQFIDNVFLSAVDDCFDMDGTDAHIEGNIFLNVHQDAARDSSSNPISSGADGGNRSELVIVRNIFWNCDHALLLKDFGSAVFQNNTVVNIATNQFSSIAAAYINFSEPHRGVPGGRGILMDGNILWDLHSSTPFLNFTNGTMFFEMTHSIIQDFPQPGFGNSTNDPLFVNGLAAMTAANIRSNLALLPGSPAIGTGPNGLDMGALVPSGASLSGAPVGTTTNTSATLRVAGPGVVAFRWKLNDGPWSEEIPLTNVFLIGTNYWNPTNGFVVLNGLADGDYAFTAIGKNSTGAWQESNTAVSKSWTVESSTPLRIDGASRVNDTVTLTFTAQAGLTYSVLYRDAFDAAHPWVKHSDVSAQGSTGPLQVIDNGATGATRFYRIVTPAQP